MRGMLPPQGQDDDEPSAKKGKFDESDLMSEDVFMRQNPPNVTFRVQVPDLPDKSDWQCQGQTLSVNAQLSDSVRTIYNCILVIESHLAQHALFARLLMAKA